jgi:hypothetical protein
MGWFNKLWRRICGVTPAMEAQVKFDKTLDDLKKLDVMRQIARLEEAEESLEQEETRTARELYQYLQTLSDMELVRKCMETCGSTEVLKPATGAGVGAFTWPVSTSTSTGRPRHAMTWECPYCGGNNALVRGDACPSPATLEVKYYQRCEVCDAGVEVTICDHYSEIGIPVGVRLLSEGVIKVPAKAKAVDRPREEWQPEVIDCSDLLLE